MTDQTAFEYRDPDYDLFRVGHAPHHPDGPRIILHTEFAHDSGTDTAEVAVPLDRVEEVVAGIRDAARQAAGQPAADETAPWIADGRHGPTPEEAAAGLAAATRPVKVRVVQVTDEPAALTVPDEELAPLIAAAGLATLINHKTERCTSCEHGMNYHDVDGRCWFTVEQGVPGRDCVCSCLRRIVDETDLTEDDLDAMMAEAEPVELAHPDTAPLKPKQCLNCEHYHASVCTVPVTLDSGPHPCGCDWN